MEHFIARRCIRSCIFSVTRSNDRRPRWRTHVAAVELLPITFAFITVMMSDLMLNWRGFAPTFQNQKLPSGSGNSKCKLAKRGLVAYWPYSEQGHTLAKIIVTLEPSIYRPIQATTVRYPIRYLYFLIWAKDKIRVCGMLPCSVSLFGYTSRL